MGIRGLQTFIEGKSRFFITEDIKALVNEFKESKQLNSRPLLVIDTPNILRPLLQVSVSVSTIIETIFRDV